MMNANSILKYLIPVSCIIAFMLTGCDFTEKEIQAPKPAESQESTWQTGNISDNAQWYAGYSLDTDRITIQTDEKDSQVIEITDPNDIELLSDEVSFSKWESTTLEERYGGMNYYFIDFNNGTSIGIYKDVAYGNVGEGISNDKDILNLLNSSDPCVLPEDLLTCVRQLVDKYTDSTY